MTSLTNTDQMDRFDELRRGLCKVNRHYDVEHLIRQLDIITREAARRPASTVTAQSNDIAHEMRTSIEANRGSQPGANGALAAGTGWWRAPEKLTEEMHVAAVRAIVRATGNDDWPPAVWAAVRAAAPAQPVRTVFSRQLRAAAEADVSEAFARLLIGAAEEIERQGAVAQAATDDVPDAWKLMLAGLIGELEATYDVLAQDGPKPVVSASQLQRLRTAKQFLRDAGLPSVDLREFERLAGDTEHEGR